MKAVKLLRTFGNDKETLGTLSLTTESGVLFVCKTLELGDHNNEQQHSCILPGKYICRYTKSPHLSELAGHDVYTYEIIGVPNRAGIRIHSANYFFQLLGCIALGNSLKDLNSDGQLDVEHSGDTINMFELLMDKENFELEIIKAY